MKKQMNVGIIGAGWIGRVHSQAFYRIPLTFDLDGLKINLRNVADIDRSLVQSVSQKYGFEQWTTDWHKLVADKEIDIVDICTPNFLHMGMAIEAARNGKHIICEKPLSTSPEDCEKMIDAVEEAKVKHLINFNYRKVPGIIYVKSLVDEGELGRPFLFRAFIAQDMGFKEAVRKQWQFDSSQSGGGSLVTMGPHVIDMARYLIGDVKEVLAIGGFTGGKDRGKDGVEDQTVLLMKFENGAIGCMISNWMAHGRKHHFEFEINAEKASVFFDTERMNELQVAFGNDEERRQGFRTIYVGAPHPYGANFDLKTGMGIGIKESFVIQFYEFVSSVIQDKDASPSFYDGWFVDQVIHKAYVSSRTGQWERIPKY